MDDATFISSFTEGLELMKAAFRGAGSSTTAKFAEAVRNVRRELAEQGKDAAQFPIGKRVYVMIDDDPTRARERVLDGLRIANRWNVLRQR